MAGGSGLGLCSGVSPDGVSPDIPLNGEVGHDIPGGEDIVVRVQGVFVTERKLRVETDHLYGFEFVNVRICSSSGLEWDVY